MEPRAWKHPTRVLVDKMDNGHGSLQAWLQDEAESWPPSLSTSTWDIFSGWADRASETVKPQRRWTPNRTEAPPLSDSRMPSSLNTFTCLLLGPAYLLCFASQVPHHDPHYRLSGVGETLHTHSHTRHIYMHMHMCTMHKCTCTHMCKHMHRYIHTHTPAYLPMHTCTPKNSESLPVFPSLSVILVKVGV